MEAAEGSSNGLGREHIEESTETKTSVVESSETKLYSQLRSTPSHCPLPLPALTASFSLKHPHSPNCTPCTPSHCLHSLPPHPSHTLTHHLHSLPLPPPPCTPHPLPLPCHSPPTALQKDFTTESEVVVAIFIGVKFGVSGTAENLPQWYAIVVVLFICIYVAAFAWSWGPLGWLVPSEIFSLEIRSAAQSITVAVNMFFTFVIAQIFLAMLCHLKFGLFLFFAFFVVVMSILIYLFLPETKGVPIEEMSIMWKNHWFWGKYIPDEDLLVLKWARVRCKDYKWF